MVTMVGLLTQHNIVHPGAFLLSVALVQYFRKGVPLQTCTSKYQQVRRGTTMIVNKSRDFYHHSSALFCRETLVVRGLQWASHQRSSDRPLDLLEQILQRSSGPCVCNTSQVPFTAARACDLCVVACGTASCVDYRLYLYCRVQ